MMGDKGVPAVPEHIEELETLIEDQAEYISALEGENRFQADLICQVSQRISVLAEQRNTLWRNNLILRNDAFNDLLKKEENGH